MIRGLHGMIYSSDSGASRAFVRDVLRLPFNDVGGGWLIFDLPEGDLGFHPSESAHGATPPGTHDVSFYCDDIGATMAELEKRGVRFKHPPIDQGYGRVTYFEIPGGIEVQLYEPRYEKRKGKAAKPKAAPAKKKAPRRKARPRAKTKRRPKARRR
jgi:predicted enzyme related to lactoylglutathione lyase